MAETSGQRLSRLLSLVPWLSAHSGVSVSEAATHFGVSAKELERDLWLVVCCGLPGHGPDQLIDIQFWDDDGVINVIDPQTLQRPLRLTAAEATALLVGLRLLEQVPGNHDRAAIASATSVIERGLEGSPGAAHHTVLVDRVDPDVATAIDTALSAPSLLHIVYAGATSDAVSERTVQPLSLVRSDGRDYLFAHCETAGAQRTFRLDRILSATVVPGAVAAAAGPSRGAEPNTAVPLRGFPVTLRVAPSARWFIESTAVTHLEELDNGYASATMVVGDDQWLIRTVVGLAGTVEVLQPDPVRAAVAEAAREALGALLPGS